MNDLERPRRSWCASRSGRTRGTRRSGRADGARRSRRPWRPAGTGGARWPTDAASARGTSGSRLAGGTDLHQLSLRRTREDADDAVTDVAVGVVVHGDEAIRPREEMLANPIGTRVGAVVTPARWRRRRATRERDQQRRQDAESANPSHRTKTATRRSLW